MITALTLAHRIVPYPWSDSPLRSLVSIPVAMLLVASSLERARLWERAIVFAPLLALAWSSTPEQTLAAFALFVVASALFDADFWRGEGRGARPWFEGALLSLTLLQGAHLVWLASTRDAPGDPDAAYYFGLARHWITTGRFDDHVLWQHLAEPASARAIVHTVGDYWQPLPALLVVVPMYVFGPSHAVANVAIALFSLVGAVALWSLVTRQRLIRSRAVQLAVVVAYGGTISLERFRIDVETQSVLSTLLVLSLLSLAQRRWSLAILLAALFPLTRTDATFATATVWLCAALGARTDEAARAREVLVAAVLCLVGWNLVRFGAPFPPAAGRAPFLATYADLYALHPTLSSTTERLVLVLMSLPVQVWTATRLVARFVVAVPFGAVGAAGALLAVSAERARARRVSPTVLAMALLATAVPLLLTVLAGVVFNEGRSLQGLSAAVHLAVAWAADQALSARRAPRWLAVLGGLAVLGVALWFFRVAQPREIPNAARTLEIRSLATEIGGHTVASPLSWWVAAETDAGGVVHLPNRTPAETLEVLRRYDVELLLLESDQTPSGLAPWVPVHTFEPVQLPGLLVSPLAGTQRLRLYRITRAPREPRDEE
ncbi:MAG: hypothetical protein K1X94_11890 [Sandaracinaceae bacterium]|nr:hypothetical protein [Sandaracinaceae bacterium]